MLKYAALLFNSLALLIYQFFFADPITITQNIPASVKAGSEFVVELTLKKGTTSGFAKLQQDLPEGFTATDKNENSGGTFKFSEQAVKIIWMSLPSDEEFKIRYTVKVAEGVSGDHQIGGKFSYVSDNVKQTIEISPSTINVVGDAPAVVKTEEPVTTQPTTPTTETPAVQPPATNLTGTPTVADLSGNEGLSVSCSRKIPLSPGNEFTVELNINKGNLTGFAKLMETLPAGFVASVGETKGATFTFTDQKVKFVWVSMPSEPEFKVTYKVSSAVNPINQAVDGIFSYIENDETKKYAIPTTIIGSESTSTPVVASNIAPEKKEEQKVETPTPPAETTPVVADNTVKPTETTTPVSGVEVTPVTPTDNTKVLSASTVPVPQGDVNYRVQIAALHKAVEANTLATRYNLYEPVITEMAQGFTKYTVGSHKEYKSAHDARDIIKNKGVVGPFVTAYNSGKRITVQEALMITSQKWFR